MESRALQGQAVQLERLRQQDFGVWDAEPDFAGLRRGCAATSYQKGKNAGTAAAMSAYKQLEAQERQ
jgi:hypothetical protein